MAFGILKTREDWIRAFAILVVVAFVLEIFAFSQPQYTGAGANAGANTGAATTDLDNFQGTASANATVLSYDPAIVVMGNPDWLAGEIALMKKDGLVAYSTASEEGTTITLAQKKSFSEVVRRLYAKNASMYGFAQVSLANIKVRGPDFVKPVDSRTYSFKLAPVFESGDVIPVTFPASVQGGQLAGVGELQLQNELPVTVLVKPLSLEVKGEYFVAQVPWESRSSVSLPILQKAFPNANVTYRKRSIVTADPPLTSDQASKLSGALPAYVVNLQANTLTIASNFNDTGKITGDMEALGINVKFAASVAEIRNAGTQGIDEIKAATDGLTGRNDTTVDTSYELAARLPPYVLTDGKNYTLVNTDITLPSPYRPSELDYINVTFTPTGRVAIQISAKLPSLPVFQTSTIEVTNEKNETVAVLNSSTITNGTITGGTNSTNVNIPANNENATNATPRLPAPA